VTDTTGTGDHFSVVVISNAFDKMTLINRHKLVYKSLNQYVTKEIHALQIKAYTEEEFLNG
jgi:BolA protein